MPSNDPSTASRLTQRSHKLLLSAALESGDRSRDAWQEWQTSVDLDTLDQASFRMVPLLTRNLLKQGVDDIPKKINGIYQRTWFSNQLLFQSLSPVLTLFEEAGIPTLLHKGLSITLQYYIDMGVRPMHDIDLLVPADRGADAISLLQESEWQSAKGTPLNDLKIKHSSGFVSPSGAELDLHWHLLVDDCADPDADHDFWEAAVPLTFQQHESLTLCPADHLLQTIVHGLSRPRHSAIYWIADAVTILRREGSLNWDRLLRQAEQRQFCLAIRNALTYLDEHHSVSIPADVFSAVQLLPISRIERLEASDRVAGRVGGLGRQWARYVRRYPGHWLPLRLVMFPRYLQQVWRIDKPTAFMGRFVRKTLAQLRR